MPNVIALGIYFEDSVAENVRFILSARYVLEDCGLYLNLSKRVPEVNRQNQALLGFDLIRIDYGASFHTFVCHSIEEKLVSWFDLKLNEYGLYNDSNRWEEVSEFLNGENSWVEPVPWVVCKVELIGM
ncbi:hypothetical protein [Dyadobacter sp. NIV53]|uniref:hypothetical protein n=1 Tax=Dyadobacter sp. NIV53 TaxID=2861765 RepID=UPI001C88DBC1|nr:hypothetical protein [Dyadobacter sp. NIV53]